MLEEGLEVCVSSQLSVSMTLDGVKIQGVA